ncbi:unnamed protein product [Amoebophrya sp. A25]|nr:unnamed protein product [Amoebophrya sp. A25]|eukprot:GSA25T00003651001.1
MSGKLAVFNLPDDTKEEELEDIFSKYGRLSRCCVRRTRAGDTMAFVEYSDSRDAEDAKDGRNGYAVGDRRLRVEFSNPPEKGKGRRGDSRRRRDSRRRDSRSRGGKRGGGKGSAKAGGLRDSYFKVEVVGIPPTASWQDVKDFLRRAGNVKFTDVDRDIGIGGFDNESDARAAVKELDGQTFTARDGDRAKVEVVMAGGPGRGSRSRSRSRRDSRGRHACTPCSMEQSLRKGSTPNG